MTGTAQETGGPGGSPADRGKVVAIAATAACIAIGAAIALGLLAVYLARHGGRLPGMSAIPRITIAVTRPVPDYPVSE